VTCFSLSNLFLQKKNLSYPSHTSLPFSFVRGKKKKEEEGKTKVKLRILPVQNDRVSPLKSYYVSSSKKTLKTSDLPPNTPERI
jgi:hypothetical protein